MESCDIEPLRYQSTPQAEAESGVSGDQINQQFLEDWLARFQRAVCNDLQELEARIAALEAAP